MKRKKVFSDYLVTTDLIILIYAAVVLGLLSLTIGK